MSSGQPSGSASGPNAPVRHQSHGHNGIAEVTAAPDPNDPHDVSTEFTRDRHRVRFNAGGESLDSRNHRATFNIRDDSQSPTAESHALQPEEHRTPTREEKGKWVDRTPRGRRVSPAQTDGADDGREPRDYHAPTGQPGPPRPAIRRDRSYTVKDHDIIEEHGEEEGFHKAYSQASAQNRARNLSRRVGSAGPATAANTPIPSPGQSPTRAGSANFGLELGDIPLSNLDRRQHWGDDHDTESDDDAFAPNDRSTATSEAHHLVRTFTHSANRLERHRSFESPPLRSGQVTPLAERDPDFYVPPPQAYRGGILSTLLKLYGSAGDTLASMASGPGINPAHLRRGSSGESASTSASQTPGYSPSSSGAATPRSKNPKWYKNKAHHSTSSLAGLIESSAVLAAPAASLGNKDRAEGGRILWPGSRRPIQPPGSRKVSTASKRSSRPRLEDEIRITVHIAETISRQKYMVKLCRALMSFGAPTHRLEEYMRMTSRVLGIEGQFLYIPGCMIISFDDPDSHTTEVKLVRTNQGVNLGKLREVHKILKSVVHDVVGIEEATQELNEIIKRAADFSPWIIVLMYGLASAFVGPFAFQARLIDMPIAFALGTLLGVLQLIVAPRSDLYSNVFEISAAVATSFLARMFGSISDGEMFCFSALAQSSIALILPGYMVLCGSLELQSKNIVAGSVRMVYAIIYSLFLGFGITIGTAFYGLMDKDATSATECQGQLSPYYSFLFVPPFTMCLVIINQGKWDQAPVMLGIALIGYVVNFFSSREFPANAQISNTLGALTVGLLGNVYSRVRHGVAAAAILPAIFVQVPSGLAASGSLVSGVTSANQITNITNGTAGHGATTISSATDASQINSVVFNVGYSMIQVAIGITVGLFLSALVVYPFGKRRSGLFSF
ncbi:MAG: hypothetical protein M1817_004114 [Caeruleum heppii]|nr:MAG: hypothetical protein M1817_004114 [Caeruleum heppii]